MTIKYFNVKNGLTTGNIALHASNSNVVASTFTGNIVVTSSANLGAAGNITITGGSANYVLSTDGAGNLSWVAQGGGGGSYSNTNVAAYLPTYAGNVSANYFIGNGSTLTYITGSNVTGYVPNATTANTAATVTSNAQPNITSVGTLTGLTVAGNIIPSANVTYSLGNSTNRFQDLYLAGNSIYLDSQSISSNSTGINVNGLNVSGNISGTDLTIAQAPKTYSINFNNTNYANVTASNLLGSGDYTIEFWIKTTDGDNGIMVSNPAGASGHPAIFVNNNDLVFQRRYAVANTILVDFSSFLDNAWHHIAFVRSSGTISLYIDGTRITTASNSDNYSSVTAGLTFGWSQQTFNYLNGNLSNFRIVNGTAVYTGASFAVPTSALTAISGTTLLAFQSSTLVDNSGSGYTRTWTSSGSPTISTTNPFGTIGTGNIVSGNISGGNLVTANYFSGNGSLLTSITGANVTGYVPNATNANTATSANTAATVTTAAQPNITSVGTLTSLNVSGDALITGNLTVSGTTEYTNVTNLYVKDPIIELGGGANNTPLTTNDGKDRGTLLHYYTTGTVDAFMGWDNSNAEFAFGSNVSVSSEVVTFNNFGNIRAGYFIGNGSTLTSLTGSNVTGYVPNATNANTVTTAAQPNITSVGTLTSLTVSGLVTATGTGIKVANIQDSTGTQTITTKYNNVTGDVGVYGNIIAGTNGTGNVTATYFIGDGSLLSNINAGNISGSYSNTNVASYLPTYTGNISGNNVSLTGTISTGSGSGNISGANYIIANYFSGNGSLLTNITGGNVTGQVSNALIAGTVYTNSQPNITSVGTLSSLTVTGNVSAGNITGATYLAGTLTTASQPNITSVGTLSSLTVTSNVSAGNVKTDNLLYANGTAWTFGSTYSNANVASYLPTYTGNISGNNVSLTGSISTGTGTGNISGANYIIANYFSGDGSLLTSITAGNINGQVSNALIAGTVYTNAQPNITSLGNLTSVTVTGNATIGNVKTDNLLYANGTAWSFGGSSYSNSNVASYLPTYTGNVSANYFIGNGATLTFITGSNVSGYVPNSNIANTAYSVAVANVTGIGNISTINIDGNASNLLYGNGIFAASPTVNPSVTVDTFTGNGVQTNFTLSTEPSNVNFVTVNYNGTILTKDNYSITGNSLTFVAAPANGYTVEISTLAGNGTGGGGSSTSRVQSTILSMVFGG